MITGRALAALMKNKSSEEKIYVTVVDPTGHQYKGRVAAMQQDRSVDRNSTCTVLSEEDGYQWEVPVSELRMVDIRPVEDDD